MTDVTIVVATYDRPAWCEVALRSAIATADAADATVRILLLDHGSPTGYARRLAARYQVDYRQEPQAVKDALPRTFASLDSTYVAVLYDDDALMASWLRLSLAEMAEGFDVVAASYWQTDAELRPTQPKILKTASLRRMLRGQCPVNDGALIRRSVLEGVAWHTERQTATMFSLWLDLLAKGARFGIVTEPCWYYRRHPGQMSAHLPSEDAAWRAQAIAEHQVPA